MHKKKGKSSYLLFKIDFEKAYDRINWDFLRATMMDFGFHHYELYLLDFFGLGVLQ